MLNPITESTLADMHHHKVCQQKNVVSDMIHFQLRNFTTLTLNSYR